MKFQVAIVLAWICIQGCLASSNSYSEGPREPVASWTFTEHNGGADLTDNGENPVILKDLKYGTGPDDEIGGAVVLPFWRTERMIVMNPTEKLKFSSEMTYFTYVYISGGHTEGALFHYNTGYQIDRISGSGLFVWPSKSLTVSGTGLDFTARKVLNRGSWNKIAVVWNPSSISIYVNGELVKSKTGKVDLSGTQQGNIHMGYRPANMIVTLDGRMACAKFFNVSLTEDEVKYLTCDVPEKKIEPVASWTFSEPYNGTDLSQYGENPVTISNLTYGLGPNDEPWGGVILPSRMIVVDPTEKLRFLSEMTYFTYLYLSERRKEGVLFEYNTDNQLDKIQGSSLWVTASKTLRVTGTGLDVIARKVLKRRRWNKIAVVWNSSSISLYVNGELVKSETGNVDLSGTQQGNLHMGYRPGNMTIAFGGRMACAKFFDVALTEETVQGLTCDIPGGHNP